MLEKNKKTIEEIFGIKKVSAVPGDMDIRYEVTKKDARERLLRDADGHYYLAAESVGDGCQARLGMATYTFEGQVILPVCRESALSWSYVNLCGNELAAAMEEFGEYASFSQIIWEHNEMTGTGQEDIREWLMESESGDFVLYSTEHYYPLCDGGTIFIYSAENGDTQFAGDVNVYYIPAETARRWAEAHGMDADTCATVFG